jgi:hypothetical protein
MRFEVCGRGIVVAAVVEQGPYVALVVDLDSLLCARRVVAGRGRLKHEPIDGSEDEQLANNSRHVVGNSICARRATSLPKHNSGHRSGHRGKADVTRCPTLHLDALSIGRHFHHAALSIEL